MADTIIARFMDKVACEPNTGCWLWLGALTPTGYPTFWINGQTERAHRVSYELFKGPIPEGLTVDHTCHDPKVCLLGEGCPHRSCVNPEHLAAVTDLENMRRGHGSKRGQLAAAAVKHAITHCPQGHEYSPDNTYIYSQKRQCRACRKVRWQAAARLKQLHTLSS